MPAPEENIGVDEWLDQATRGLGYVAMDRIRDEIVAHYDATVQSVLEDGASEHDARTRALAELGDASEAKKKYRKVNLKRRDEWYVRGIMKQLTRPRVGKPSVVIFIFAFVILPAVVIPSLISDPSMLAGFVIPAYVVVAVLLTKTYFRRSKSTTRHRTTLHMYLAMLWSMAAIGGLAVLGTSGLPLGWFMISVASATVLTIAFLASMHRRIMRKLSDDDLAEIIARVEQEVNRFAPNATGSGPMLSLSEWLDQATSGLGDLAKDRIHSEVTAHYEALLQTAVEGGAIPSQAETAAIADLGDPLVARKGFRRANLGPRDERIIAKLVEFFVQHAFVMMLLIIGYVAPLYFIVLAPSDIELALELDITDLFAPQRAQVALALPAIVAIPLWRIVVMKKLLARKKYQVLLHTIMVPVWFLFLSFAAAFFYPTDRGLSRYFSDPEHLLMGFTTFSIQGLWLYVILRFHWLVARKTHDTDLAILWADVMAEKGRFS